MNTKPTSAWKNPWFLLVIGLPAIVVVACFVTLYLAIVSDDGVVSDDYYKEGLAINQDLRRDKQARAYELKASLTLHDKQAELHLSGTPAANAALTGMPIKLVLQNMGLPAQDQTLTLVPSEKAGVWRTTLTQTAPKGVWHIRLESGDWRLSRKIDGLLNQTIEFK
ncbi:MAG: FixH family protein [Formosimonas sp.]